ncbi:MAG: SRPBCC domain-containing protein [Candidatus Eisenbacteria bacterium]|uniref:SRPBCC domain-containing protein n=1 Tax=Eiseniibacteriota bacterium TaxID=2212470 RepID=A0A933SFA0_UNCEI|nr:SRPBCC domain-containing protein [Candidatus Eisenbacteria bacterium]
MSDTITLTFDVLLSAPSERVFKAITEGRHLERWFCDACESEAHEDGRLTMRWHRLESTSWPYEATWTEFTPPSHCACIGGHQGYPNRDAGRIDFDVEAREGGATLVVRHSLPDLPEYAPHAEQYRHAWPRALARLKLYLSPTTREQS